MRGTGSIPTHTQPRWPRYLIGGVGAVMTVVGLLWAATLYDGHGTRIIDANVALVLVAVLGPGGTVGLYFGAKSLGAIKHEVKNNHGTNMRNDLDHMTKVIETVAGDVRGIRRDNGRIANRLDQTAVRLDHTNMRLDKLAEHVDDIEDTVIPKKEK